VTWRICGDRILRSRDAAISASTASPCATPLGSRILPITRCATGWCALAFEHKSAGRAQLRLARPAAKVQKVIE